MSTQTFQTPLAPENSHFYIKSLLALKEPNCTQLTSYAVKTLNKIQDSKIEPETSFPSSTVLPKCFRMTSKKASEQWTGSGVESFRVLFSTDKSEDVHRPCDIHDVPNYWIDDNVLDGSAYKNCNQDADCIEFQRFAYRPRRELLELRNDGSGMSEDFSDYNTDEEFETDTDDGVDDSEYDTEMEEYFYETPSIYHY